MSPFYNPYEKKMSGATAIGGISDIINQFLMLKMIKQMYPDKKKEQRRVGTSQLPTPRIGANAPGTMQQNPDIMQLLMQLLQSQGQPPGQLPRR